MGMIWGYKGSCYTYQRNESIHLSTGMMMDSVLRPLVILSFGWLAFYFLLSKRRPRMSLPPGPKSLPILGNLLDMPKDKPWVKYSQWSEEYGMLQYTIIIVVLTVHLSLRYYLS